MNSDPDTVWLSPLAARQIAAVGKANASEVQYVCADLARAALPDNLREFEDLQRLAEALGGWRMSDRDVIRAAVSVLTEPDGGVLMSYDRTKSAVAILEAALAAPDPQAVVDAAIAHLDSIDWTPEAAATLKTLVEAVEPFRSKTP